MGSTREEDSHHCRRSEEMGQATVSAAVPDRTVLSLLLLCLLRSGRTASCPIAIMAAIQIAGRIFSQSLEFPPDPRTFYTGRLVQRHHDGRNGSPEVDRIEASGIHRAATEQPRDATREPF